ncbi:MAG: hypothetical protein ACRC7D_10530 [Aeromonas popoffii]|uniref:hypothetical protein n=1 Tax=Aeromonas popoffii TaxID=70856 RepID=UPI003F3D4B9A
MTNSIKKNRATVFLNLLLAVTVISFFMGWISFGWCAASFFILTYLKEDLVTNFIERIGSPLSFCFLLAITIFSAFNDKISSGLAVTCIIALSFTGVISALISNSRRRNNGNPV